MVVRDYLAGRTVPYANPAKYLLLSTTLLVVLATALGADSAAAAEGWGGVVTFIATYSKYLPVGLALVVPVAAASTKAFFAPSGRNYAEHLVFNAFILGQMALLGAGLVALPALREQSVGWTVLVVLATLIILPAYYLSAARKFFGRGRISTVVRSAAVLAATLPVYLFLLIIASGVWDVLVG